MDVDDVEEIAQGKVWTGKQAQAIGLVDELGGLHSAIAYCQQNFTEDGNASVVTWPPRKSLLEILSGGSEDLEDNLPGGLASAQSLITTFFEFGYGHPINFEYRGLKIPPAVSGMMLTIDEDWAIRCMLQNEEQVPDFMSYFPPSVWD